MDLLDLGKPDHAQALSEIRRFCTCAGNCRPTGRVKEDLIRLGLTKGSVLNSVVNHIDAGHPVYSVMLTMYFETPRVAYVIKPLMVGKLALYFKVALPVRSMGEKTLLILSAHEVGS